MSPRPWIPVPSALQHDASIPRGARDLWILLDDLARDGRAVYATVAATGPFLTAAMDCGQRSLQRWRDVLVARSWLAYDPGVGRGVPSYWTPLRRAREVTHPGVIDADRGTGKSAKSRPSWQGFDQGKSATVADFHAPYYKDRAREEEHPLRGTPSSSSRPGWCGVCDDRTRLRERPEDGRPFPCPACHPDSVPAF